jgi:hypothetical protein
MYHRTTPGFSTNHIMQRLFVLMFFQCVVVDTCEYAIIVVALSPVKRLRWCRQHYRKALNQLGVSKLLSDLVFGLIRQSALVVLYVRCFSAAFTVDVTSRSEVATAVSRL